MRAKQTPKTHNTSLQPVPAYNDEAQVTGVVRAVLSQRTNLDPNAPLSPKNGQSTTHRLKKNRTLDVTSPSFGPSYAQMARKKPSPDAKAPLTPTEWRRWSQPTTPITGLKNAQMQLSPEPQTPKAPTQPRSPNTQELFSATQEMLSPATLDTERREKLVFLAARVRYVDAKGLEVLKAEGRPYGLKVTDERITKVLPLSKPSKSQSFQPEPDNAELEDYVQMDPITPKFDPDSTPRTPELLGPMMNERPVPGAHKQTDALTPRRDLQMRLHDALKGANGKRARRKVVAGFKKEAESIGVEIRNTKNGIECVNREVEGPGPTERLLYSPNTAFFQRAKNELEKAPTHKAKMAAFKKLTLDAPVLGFKVTGNPDNFSVETQNAISQAKALSPTPSSKRSWADVAKSPPTPGAKILHGPEKKAATAAPLPSVSANNSFRAPNALSASGFLEDSTDFINMSDASSRPASAAGKRSANTSTASDRHLANLRKRTAGGSVQKEQSPQKPSSLRKQVLSPGPGSPLKRVTTASAATPPTATPLSKLSYAQMAASPPSPAAKIVYGPEKKPVVLSEVASQSSLTSPSASPPMGQSTPMKKTPKAAVASSSDAFALQRDRLNRELHQRWASKHRTQPGKSNVRQEMGRGIVLNAAKQPLAKADSKEEATDGQVKGRSPYMRSNGRDGAYISLRSSIDRAVSMAGRTGPVDRSLRGAARSAAARDRFRAAVGRVILRNRAAKNGTRMSSVHRDISRGRSPSSTWSRPSRRD